MFRLPNKFLLLLCATMFFSCGFIDFRQIKFSVEPDKTNSVLPEYFSPVILKFDTEMIKNDTEGILQISSDLGTVNGDKVWRGNALYFMPIQGWTAGVRYTMSLNGTVHSVDGRELRLEHFISFYAVNRNDPPVLEWHSPLSGESISVNNVFFDFYFSKSMDRLSVESALTVDGIGNKKFEWSDNDRRLKVAADKALSPWTLYKWNFKRDGKKH